MNKRQLGQSELYVSELGLGCMSLGTSKEKAKAIIDAALDEGVNYLDTADLYDQGMNEELIGELIKEKRHKLIIATKVGNRFEKGVEGWNWDPSRTHIKSAIKDSLQRLQTDYIDLYQLHGGTKDDPVDEIIDTFEELKKEGLIREYGISSIRPNVIKEYVTRSNIVSVMMQYNLFDRRPEELFPFLKQHHISVVARGPVAKGLLTERPFDSHLYKDGYLDYSLPELEQFQKEYAMNQIRPLQETALNYCLHSSVVASVIAGASSASQVQVNAKAVSSQALDPDEVQWIQQHTKANIYHQHRASF